MVKIVLLGYMAVGKSTVGKILAEKLKITFVDLDETIEKNENLSISEIFANHGEIYFRKKDWKKFMLIHINTIKEKPPREAKYLY